MKKNFCLFCILISLHAFSQTGTFLKIYYNYPPYFTITSVAPVSDGGYLALFAGAATTPMAVKTDSAGNVLLTNTLCGEGGFSLRNTSDSNFVFVTVAGVVCPGTPFYHYKLYKINGNGDTLWAKTFGSSNDDIAVSIRPLKDGTFALTGYTLGADNFYKLDASGNVIWHHHVPMYSVESVIQDSENNFVLCGYTDITPNSWTVIKTDSSGGSILWSKYYGNNGGNLNEKYFDLVQLSDSNYLVTGSYPQFITKINKNTGDSIWNNSTPAKIESIDKVINGKYIAAGEYRLRLVNDMGGVVWTKSFPTLTFYWVRATSDGGFIAAGSYFVGTQEWPMLLKTDSLGNFTTDVEQLNIKAENYSLYPNPLITQSRLEFGNAKHEQFVFTLFDITGRQIENAATNGDHFIINKDSKQSGLYFFKLENEKTGEVENGKVVIR